MKTTKPNVKLAFDPPRILRGVYARTTYLYTHDDPTESILEVDGPNCFFLVACINWPLLNEVVTRAPTGNDHTLERVLTSTPCIIHASKNKCPLGIINQKKNQLRIHHNNHRHKIEYEWPYERIELTLGQRYIKVERQHTTEGSHAHTQKLHTRPQRRHLTSHKSARTHQSQ